MGTNFLSGLSNCITRTLELQLTFEDLFRKNIFRKTIFTKFCIYDNFKYDSQQPVKQHIYRFIGNFISLVIRGWEEKKITEQYKGQVRGESVSSFGGKGLCV